MYHAGQDGVLCADDAPAMYNMVCYKCGTDITCAVEADASDINVNAIQDAFKLQCTGSTQKRSCAGQLCAGDLAVYAADCLPYSGDAGVLRAQPLIPSRAGQA